MQNPADPAALIVEDEPLLARLLELLLQNQGYHTLIAATAEAALEHLQTLQPRLITLDLNLPGMSGGDLLRRLRSDPLTMSLPVIVISAFPEGEPVIATYAQAVLHKPFDFDTFTATIRHVDPRTTLRMPRSASG